jgi:lysyl-tRNA synthetase
MAISPGLGCARPYRFPGTDPIGEVRTRSAGLGPDDRAHERVRVAGRVVLVRRHGGLVFAQLRDGTGEIQLLAERAVLGSDRHAAFVRLRRGDWLGVEGGPMTTRTGELSLCVAEFSVLAEATRWTPGKRGELGDVEARYRRRYLDLAVNPRAREIFRIRHATVAAVRARLVELGFVEVETPMLHTVHTGAAARPFITHHNALDVDMYLRIAPELHLKRLIVGGMERVFELGRVFRNEAVDARHNPEFTLLEAYCAFADYHDMMELTEDLVATAARAAWDGATVSPAPEPVVDLTPPWPRVRLADLIEQITGARMHPDMAVEEARAILDGLGLRYEDGWGPGRLMQRVYDERVQPTVAGPLLCVDFPAEVSPLAREHRADPAYAERFELLVAGSEVCNAYSEQNDPAAQRAAFDAEARARAAGDVEAGEADDDYLHALEQGMPPTGGLGLGIDRLVALLARADSLRDVLLFPTLRPPAAPAPDTPLPPAPGPDPVTELATAGPVPEGPPLPDVRHALGPDPGARMIAVLTAVGGVFQLLAPLPAVQGRLGLPQAQLGPVWLPVLGNVVSVLVGLLLLLLADQLRKSKRAAWRVAAALFAVAAAAHLIKGPHLVAAGFCVGMLVALLVTRRRFTAAPDPPSLLRLVRFVPLYLIAVVGFGFAALGLEHRWVQPRLTVAGDLQEIFAGLVGVDGPYTFRSRFFADFFPDALLTLGVLGLAGFAFLLLRPLASRHSHTPRDWEHARRLVAHHGWDTLAPFALRPDKSWFFSADGEAMLAYSYLNGYALVAGDPVGAAGSVSRVVDEFLEMCRRRAWNTAFLAVREHDVPFYLARGFRSFYLGDEAVLRCDTFTLKGRRALRSAVRRVGRRYRFEILPESQAAPELVDRLNALSRRWRGKAPERGFTMSLGQAVGAQNGDPERLLCLAINERDEPGGFLRIVPAAGRLPGYTLDLMRRDPHAPNGITEFLIASTALGLKERRVVRFSLNFALWGRLFADDTAFTPAQRAARWAVSLVNPFFQVKSLHEFNAKFGPQWLPRVIAYRGPADLPRVGLLYAGAEGFLALPGLGPLLLPRPADDAGPQAGAAAGAAGSNAVGASPHVPRGDGVGPARPRGGSPG